MLSLGFASVRAALSRRVTQAFSTFTTPMLKLLVNTAHMPKVAANASFPALLVVARPTVGGYSGSNALVKAVLFPVEIRALGVGLPHAPGVAVLGGPAEYSALWCKGIGHKACCHWYTAVCVGISLVVLLTVQGTCKTSQLNKYLSA
ncbi:hypothetical protein QMK33_08480 [Hymenobacter sp. H14-R3]|uniref:hypothetical protein n=1 Tax=Hymenobacter sp. H14-R3 TaxID=3046308 RepID=UPI0024B98B38|nr:hypothetical protein [Hymenobacter sp. H14-R3]MDJ0365187.1 hypothetical protein [Hymenobacter sp. H14-R3]